MTMAILGRPSALTITACFRHAGVDDLDFGVVVWMGGVTAIFGTGSVLVSSEDGAKRALGFASGSGASCFEGANGTMVTMISFGNASSYARGLADASPPTVSGNTGAGITCSAGRVGLVAGC